MTSKQASKHYSNDHEEILHFMTLYEQSCNSQVTPLRPYDSNFRRPTASNHRKLGAAIACGSSEV